MQRLKQNPPRSLVGVGLAVGLGQLTNLLFDIHKPYTVCCICGDVYQTSDDRVYGNNPVTELARKEWSHAHAREHSSTQHRQLALSGRQFTPEAANKLAAFGIISVSDMVMDNEVEDALRLSKPIPFNDSED